MKAKRVGSIIPKRIRNCGNSYGLQYNHIYGRLNDQVLVWHRHTGKVVFIAAPVAPNLWQGFADHEAARHCERLNAEQIGRTDGRLPIDFASIDETP